MSQHLHTLYMQRHKQYSARKKCSFRGHSENHCKIFGFVFAFGLTQWHAPNSDLKSIDWLFNTYVQCISWLTKWCLKWIKMFRLSLSKLITFNSFSRLSARVFYTTTKNANLSIHKKNTGTCQKQKKWITLLLPMVFLNSPLHASTLVTLAASTCYF